MERKSSHQFQKGLLRPVGGCLVPFSSSDLGSSVNFSGWAAIDFDWHMQGRSVVYSLSQYGQIMAIT